MSFFKRLRHFYMGLLTVMPGPPKGWFIPYRYASTVSAPNRYSALEPVFKLAESDFRSFLKEIDSYYTDLFAIGGDPPPQPRWEQGWFPRLDAAAAYTMVRKHQPRRIVEIGSGHSTRFLLGQFKTASLIANLFQLILNRGRIFGFGRRAHMLNLPKGRRCNIFESGEW